MVLFDQGFEVASGMYNMPLNTGWQVQTLSRSLTFKCKTKRTNREWIEALRETTATTGKLIVLN